MLSITIQRILGFIALALIATFVIGLSHSISTGTAGFWGGLPFATVVFVVLCMAAYNYWETCWKKK